MPDFPYINARVRAMRSRLFDPGRMEELLTLPTLDALIQALANSPYGPELQEALTRYTGIRAVDEALARNFYHATTKILGFADGRPRALIEAILMRWDRANILVILRGKHNGRPEEEILTNLFPAGGLGQVALRELVSQPDVAGVLGALGGLGHPFATALAEGLSAYQKTQDLLELELHLDRAYATYGLQVAEGGGYNEQIVRQVLQAELDATNVKTALKLRRAGPASRKDLARFFIPGGRIVTEELFLKLADAATFEQGVRGLRVRGFAIKADQVDDLAAFERELDMTMIQEQAARYLEDPLSIDIVIAYLALKYSEVVNLRLIARSKALGIPRDRVRQEMVSV